MQHVHTRNRWREWTIVPLATPSVLYISNHDRSPAWWTGISKELIILLIFRVTVMLFRCPLDNPSFFLPRRSAMESQANFRLYPVTCLVRFFLYHGLASVKGNA